jgi:hypothetical protein
MLWVRAQLPTPGHPESARLASRAEGSQSPKRPRASLLPSGTHRRGSRKRLIRPMKRFPSSRNYLQYKGFGALTALGPRPDEIRNPLPQLRI